MREMGIEEWNAYRQLCLDQSLIANHVSDAFITASARVIGARLTTFDRDFLWLLPSSALELLSAN